MPEGPLAGFRVFDLTLAMVGPWTSMLLGGMGAEIIHVEATDRDLNAGIHPTINGTSIGYLDVQMNKRQIVLDLKSPEDRQHAYDIIKTCDVFLMNMRPDVASRLGVDYETVSQINDQIVYCAVTGWGPDGPMREIPGADPQVRYIAGFHEATGLEGGDTEVYRHSTQIDETTGNYAAQSILMGLLARERTGKGQRVDISMLRATSAMQSGRIGEFLASGRRPPPQGHQGQSIAPDAAFLCADKRHLAVAATSEADWVALCRAIGHLEFIEDLRFATNSDRVANRHDLMDALEPVFRSMPLDYWVLELDKVGLTVARVMRWDELRRHAQVTANEYIVDIKAPPAWEPETWEHVWTGGPPWRFSATPARWHPPVPINHDRAAILDEIKSGREA